MIMETITVAIQFLGGTLPAIIILAIVDLILLALLIGRVGSSFRNFGRALGSALGVGGVVALISVFLLPAHTGASWANLHGATDYLGLLGISIGLGLAAAAAVFPPIQYLLGMASTGRDQRQSARA
ncbi:hypothetical protein [Halorhodospira halophila]|uniref:Uncharacterized protein n=1 Tax=Halorhodospira halophila (strain DSM 244 / SL1) TaxID=349124 RepID=A1WXL8_HALHL|nr:hypothetical protein [Halorhodospira halophila]ABM62430.1 conserved hypothetical protein [Halorhodospira halophila SL1]MBK1729559.1 hypothetical protein [Halorhodospira halophila]